MSSANNRRVVITGVGMVTPIGVGRDATWAAARAGTSGTGRPTLVAGPETPIQVVGEVKDFVAASFIPKKLVVRTDRNTHFAFASGIEALADANLDLEGEDKRRVGIVMSSNYGGLSYYLDNLVRLHQKGPSFVSAYMAIAWIPSAPVGQLSIFYGISGYTKTIVNDAAGGTDAIGVAYRAIKRDDADLIIAGGFEAALAEAAVAGLAKFADICQDAPDPARAFRPFNSERNGIVIAEGGAVVILEEYERARARGAPIYGEITGFAQTSDAVDIHHFATDGVQYARAMRLALEQGFIAPADVSYLHADGRGTEVGDRAEAAAIHRLFGEQATAVPVTAPKSMFGNSLAGAGPIDVALSALALRDGVIPPTINIDRQDPQCALDVVTTARETTVNAVLLGSRGTGGVNAGLALRRVD